MSFHTLLASEHPLVMPGAHDAISARLIQRAGFKAYFIGGFDITSTVMMEHDFQSQLVMYFSGDAVDACRKDIPLV